MRWPAPNPDRTKRKRELRDAASALRESVEVVKKESAREVINSWRMAHQVPLNAVTVTLRDRVARLGNSEHIVVQRIKRLSTIEDKLCREPEMQLDRMFDIGGCRAVVSDLDELGKLSSSLLGSRMRHGRYQTRDYVTNPKGNGYRSFHQILDYQSRLPSAAPWNGLKVEVQLRTMSPAHLGHGRRSRRSARIPADQVQQRSGAMDATLRTACGVYGAN